MAQQLRILPVEGLWSVPSIHMGWLKTACAPEDLVLSSGFKGNGTHVIHIHNADKGTQKIKTKESS